MNRLTIAMDLGTSGFRVQAIELATGEIISTAITLRHPLPGANVMDQVRLVLNRGMDYANGIIIQAINRLIYGLRIPVYHVVRIAFCGNPVQLSLLQKIEVADLAYSGQRKVESLGISQPRRDAVRTTARELPGLDLPEECEVIIPPAVRHEVGADALALIMKTGFLEKKENAIAIDFGTNAEIALFHSGQVFTGSTAAGPALEDREITCGKLAAPGVICDLVPEESYYRIILLDQDMFPVRGPLIDLRKKGIVEGHDMEKPTGITGTGTIAIVQQAMEAGLITIPRINTIDRRLHLGEDLFMTEDDLAEAGKAFGAVRAGYMTLCQEADITPSEVHTAYISGASGTYVDAVKAKSLGLLPPGVETVFQTGNTSLSMARDLVMNPDKLDEMITLGNDIRKNHCMFAASPTFKKIFLLEFSYWTEGMPMSQYRMFLKKYGLSDLISSDNIPKVIHTVKRDIDDLGRLGLMIVNNGAMKKVTNECVLTAERSLE
jgi:methylamine methyltransferase corrinoid protein reductive activase